MLELVKVGNAKKIAKISEMLKDKIIRTPLVKSNHLSQLVGGEIYLKLENLQRTGAFKIRGAYNKLDHLQKKENVKTVITCSAGNHAQGVALASSMLGIKAIVYMPKNASQLKINATKKLGGDVVLAGENFDQTKKIVLNISNAYDIPFISPFDDLDIILGQGTLGKEIIDDLTDVDNVVIPIGGGGLIAGVSLYVKELNPDIKIIGVQAQKVHGMLSSIWNKSLVYNRVDKTIADGCDVALAGKLPYEILRDLIDETILVEEDEIKAAMRFLLEKEKVVSEGAGALSTAAVISGKLNHLVAEEKTVLLVSGGNVDLSVLKVIFE